MPRRGATPSSGVPRCTTRPASSTAISSASAAASSKSWVTATAGATAARIVRPCSREACARVRASSAASGSSSSRAFGSTASARASATRWRSPPESATGRSSAWSEAEPGEQLDRPPAPLRTPGPAQRVGDVPPHGKVAEQRVVLEHVAAAPGPAIRRAAPPSRARSRGRRRCAPGGAEEPGHALEQRRLHPHPRGRPARGHGQGPDVERELQVEPPEPQLEPVNRQQGRTPSPPTRA